MKIRLLVAACLVALPMAPSPKSDTSFQKRLGKDDQILHALDRLTFGPRPGDVERLKKVGLKKWIDQQLHPEQIKENVALELQLLPLESLRMTPMETVQRYPQPQFIKAVADGKQPLPEDPLLRATVERLVARYKVKMDWRRKVAARSLSPSARWTKCCNRGNSKRCAPARRTESASFWKPCRPTSWRKC